MSERGQLLSLENDLPGGYVVGNGGLVHPDLGNHVAFSENGLERLPEEIVLPDQKKLTVCNEDEIENGNLPEDYKIEEERLSFSSADEMRALHSPDKFVLRIMGEMGMSNNGKYGEVLGHVRGEGEKVSLDSVSRKSQIKQYYDKNDRLKKEYVATSPGVLEKVGCVIADVATGLKRVDARVAVLGVLDSLIRDYRGEIGKFSLENMPDLTRRLSEVLSDCDVAERGVKDSVERFAEGEEEWVGVRDKDPRMVELGNRSMRKSVYRILEQLECETEVGDNVMFLMDAHGDLRDPLAFTLTRKLADVDGSKWFSEHERRRGEILELIDELNEPQKLFDNYDVLQEKSRGVVVGYGILRGLGRMMSFELELETKGMPKYPLPTGLYMEKDHVITAEPLEVKRRDEILEDGKSLAREIDELRLWIRDNVSKMFSVHFHLDREEHPFHPGASMALGYVNENELDTWEMKDIFLQLVDGNLLDSASMTSVLSLLTGLSRGEGGKNDISINDVNGVDLGQMFFGQLAMHTYDAEARLSALLLMREKNFRYVLDPVSLLFVYKLKDVEKYATEILSHDLLEGRQWTRSRLGELLGYTDLIKEYPANLVDTIRGIDSNKSVGENTIKLPIFGDLVIEGIKHAQREHDHYDVIYLLKNNLELFGDYIASFLESEDVDVQCAAIRALGRDLERYGEMIVLLSKNNNWAVQVAAVEALSCDFEKYGEMLVPLLENDNRILKRAVAEVLGRDLGKYGDVLATSLVGDNDRLSFLEGTMIIRALGRDLDKYGEMLVPLIRSNKWFVREEVVKILGRDLDKYGEMLVPFLKDDSCDIRHIVVKVLSYDLERFGEILENSIDDEDWITLYPLMMAANANIQM